MTANANKHQTVQGWVALTALLLVTLWLPVTSHDWLEDMGWIHSHEDSGDGGRHDAADGYCRVEHGVLLLKAPTVTAQLWLRVFAHEATTALVAIPFSPVTAAFQSTAPPGLLATWRFSHRTACPNRAPPALV